MPTETRSPRRQAKVDLDRLRVLRTLATSGRWMRPRAIASALTTARDHLGETGVRRTLAGMLDDSAEPWVASRQSNEHGRPWEWSITDAGRRQVELARKGDA